MLPARSAPTQPPRHAPPLPSLSRPPPPSSLPQGATSTPSPLLKLPPGLLLPLAMSASPPASSLHPPPPPHSHHSLANSMFRCDPREEVDHLLSFRTSPDHPQLSHACLHSIGFSVCVVRRCHQALPRQPDRGSVLFFHTNGTHIDRVVPCLGTERSILRICIG
ncbi:hypothetical protein BC826DRAFT_742847 [Russula brevipes]|nr:hypothetical protein BC826DRAFT_742847 [Russula brevipes]